MTPTQHRIQLIAQVCQHPALVNLMGSIHAHDLTAWLEAELGHADALDTFVPNGPLKSKAIPPESLLHIVSGNTPHAAMQSLLRGLLLGSHNIMKLPSTGLPELQEWTDSFPQELKEKTSLHKKLTNTEWMSYNAVIAIGSDATIADIQKRILPHQIFIPHGHQLSIGIVYSDFETAAPLAARDISLFNQRGCLSPHAIYVEAEHATNFAALLAHAMETFAQAHPPEPLSLSEAGAVRNLRETTRFATASTHTTLLWESSNNLDWTVVYEQHSQLKPSCLNRCVYVHPLPHEINLETLGSHAKHLSTIALHPFDEEVAKNLTTLPAHRICPLGQSQEPSLHWHHDGFAPLASLVSWKDIG